MRNPRPPKKWFDDMMKRMRRQYPKEKGESQKHYEEGLAEIAGGIWFNQYTAATRRKLIRRYDTAAANPTRRPSSQPKFKVSPVLVLGGIALVGYLFWRNMRKRTEQ